MPRLIVVLGIVAAGLVFRPCASAAGPAIDPATAKPNENGDTLWYDARPLGVEGQGWADTAAPFDRLPARAEKLVRPPVWELSRSAAGLGVRFVTDAPTIGARWTLTGDRLALPHMPATGVSGLDLYTKVEGKWRWLATGSPTEKSNTATLVSGLPAGEREFLLYLPLYNGVSSVEVGLPKGTTLKKADARPADRAKPIVFYGTSITQGGCASRPGMVHTAILGRAFDRPVINLGFSGNGTLDPELAGLLGELDAAVYVIDCLPNLDPARIGERTVPFVETLRKARPTTPILLVEGRTFANAPLLPALAAKNAGNRAALKKAFDDLTGSGDKHLYYLPGDKLIGDDGESTVDGSHPTDLGFMRQAETFGACLTGLLAPERKSP